jgi:hypothetical protein
MSVHFAKVFDEIEKEIVDEVKPFISPLEINEFYDIWILLNISI